MKGITLNKTHPNIFIIIIWDLETCRKSLNRDVPPTNWHHFVSCLNNGLEGKRPRWKKLSMNTSRKTSASLNRAWSKILKRLHNHSIRFDIKCDIIKDDYWYQFWVKFPRKFVKIGLFFDGRNCCWAFFTKLPHWWTRPPSKEKKLFYTYSGPKLSLVLISTLFLWARDFL